MGRKSTRRRGRVEERATLEANWEAAGLTGMGEAGVAADGSQGKKPLAPFQNKGRQNEN